MKIRVALTADGHVVHGADTPSELAKVLEHCSTLELIELQRTCEMYMKAAEWAQAEAAESATAVAEAAAVEARPGPSPKTLARLARKARAQSSDADESRAWLVRQLRYGYGYSLNRAEAMAIEAIDQAEAAESEVDQ